MVERNAAVIAELTKLRDAYLERLPQEVAELAILSAGLIGKADAGPQLETLHQCLHKLAGSGGTFGLAGLSCQAKVLEQTVQSWLTADFSNVDAAQRRNFAEAVAALAATSAQSEPTILPRGVDGTEPR